ncbi:MAG: hypothetical protein ACHQ1D_06520 [Nitrososphaerales archaeon]
MNRQTYLIIFIALLINSCREIKYQDKEFNEIASFILNQRDVDKMDDFTRHYKSINGVSIRLSAIEGNQKAQFLYIVEDSLKLDPKIVSALRIKLEVSKLREFTKSGDTILFIVDGFLNNSSGFLYSKHDLKMDSTWFYFKGNSVQFVEDINHNWKRTAIR